MAKRSALMARVKRIEAQLKAAQAAPIVAPPVLVADSAAPAEPAACRAMTFMQPIATLIASGHLPITPLAIGVSYRGPIVIHASNRWGVDVWRACATEPLSSSIQELGYHTDFKLSDKKEYVSLGGGIDFNPIPLGAYVGLAHLTDCVLMEDTDKEMFEEVDGIRYFHGQFYKNKYQWFFSDVRMIHPISASTSIGLYKISSSFYGGLFGRVRSRPSPAPIDPELCISDYVNSFFPRPPWGTVDGWHQQVARRF